MASDVDGEHVFSADPEGPDPLIGVVLDGKYELLRPLGRGGMGAVYEAEHRMIGKRVAVKVLHKEFCSNAEIVKRFVREARSATAIGHPNIVEVFDMGTMEGGGFFQVIELLEGSSLQEVVGEGAMSYARAVAILSQVADALAAVHDKGIVHRDLKPDNVFLVRRPGNPDFVKLLDFGVAKVIDANSGLQTRTGMIIGTPSYMSPEQARGTSDVDLQTDVFALGVMAFELLTGQRPFDADTFPQILFQICIAETPELSAYRVDVPQGLQGVLERLLAKEKDARFPNCREVKEALAPFASFSDPPRLTEHQPARQPLSVSAVRKSGEPTDPFGETGVVDSEAPAPHSAESHAIEPHAIEPHAIEPHAIEPHAIEPHAIEPHAIEPQPKPPLVGPLATASGGESVPATRSSLGGIAGAAAAVLLIGATGAFVYFRSDAPPRETLAPTSSAATVRIQLQADPRGAALFLDDAPVDNPYIAELPASTAPHIVEARLEGYRPSRRAVAFEAPVNLTLSLARDPAPADSPIGEAAPDVDVPEAPRTGRGSRRPAAGLGQVAMTATPVTMTATPMVATPMLEVPPVVVTPEPDIVRPVVEDPPPQAIKNVRF